MCSWLFWIILFTGALVIYKTFLLRLNVGMILFFICGYFLALCEGCLLLLFFVYSCQFVVVFKHQSVNATPVSTNIHCSVIETVTEEYVRRQRRAEAARRTTLNWIHTKHLVAPFEFNFLHTLCFLYLFIFLYAVELQVDRERETERRGDDKLLGEGWQAPKASLGSKGKTQRCMQSAKS